MFIINCEEINILITSFLPSTNDIIRWSSVCSTNYNKRYNIPFIINTYNSNLYKQYNITYLHACNKYTSLNIRNFKNLTTLICNAKVTNYTLMKLVHLTDLNLYNNKKISNIILPNLKYLDIHSNYKLCDTSISQLTTLEYLNCGIINTRFTDNSISQLTNLVTLHTSCCNITDNVFKNMTNLRELFCDYNPKLTDGCFKYLNLYKLSFGDNIFSIKGIHAMTNLTYLSINQDNAIQNEYFKYLSNIIYFDCHYNNMVADEAILGMPKLKYLKKCNHVLTDISLCTLTELIYLDCGCNNLFTNNGFSKLKNLQVLICGYNSNIRNKTLSFFSKLLHLYCCKNRYISDSGLTHLQQLLLLDVGNNTLITHKSLLKLNKLIILDCRRNKNINIVILTDHNKSLSIQKTDQIFHL